MKDRPEQDPGSKSRPTEKACRKACHKGRNKAGAAVNRAGQSLNSVEDSKPQIQGTLHSRSKSLSR